MSESNIKIVKDFYEGESCEGLDEMKRIFDSNVEWIEPNTLPFGGTHRGFEAVLKEVMEPTMARFDGFKLQMTQYINSGDTVVAIGRFSGRNKQTGKQLDAATVHVLRLRKGKIVRFEGYHDTAKWLEALGTIEQRIAA